MTNLREKVLYVINVSHFFVIMSTTNVINFTLIILLKIMKSSALYVLALSYALKRRPHTYHTPLLSQLSLNETWKEVCLSLLLLMGQQETMHKINYHY